MQLFLFCNILYLYKSLGKNFFCQGHDVQCNFQFPCGVGEKVGYVKQIVSRQMRRNHQLYKSERNP